MSEVPGRDDFESLPPMELNEQDLVKTEQYQSLFLTNGQVYFGRLWVYPTAYVLTDIYYLQNAGEDNQTLVKLGNETHGPEDMQVHPKQHVQFWQNLKDDGSVSEAIRKYQEEKSQ